MTTRGPKDSSKPLEPPGEVGGDVAVSSSPAQLDPFNTLVLPTLASDSITAPSIQSSRATTRPVIKEISQDISESLPAGIELHRLFRYQLPLAQDSCDLIVLKLNVPEDLEHKLSEWRTAIGLRHPSTEIFIKRVEVEQNLQANLLNQFRQTEIIRSDGIPTIESMIDRICGEKPPPSIPPRPEKVAREDLTSVPFVGIDRPQTLDQEDLVYGEKKANGSLVLRAAFIDITDEIVPGGKRDKFSQKVGHTLYGRNRTISPLGSELANNGASFKCGEKRPAWVVECGIHPGKPDSEYFKVRRAWVKNHADVDPSKPFDPASNKEIAKNLSALAEITRILAHRRTRRSPFIRIDGQGAASQIVAETMIHSKRLLAQYLSKHSPTGVIYRVHQKPTNAMIDECVKELKSLKIPVSADTFERPGAFREALSALERNGTHRAHALTNQILDLLLFRTVFSTENIRHFGLGDIEYLEIKPRAGGIPNQFILDAIFTGKEPPAIAELNRRAKDLNKKRWSRDERMYTLRFLEMLSERLLETGHIFLAEISRVGGDTMYCQVESFPKWGVIRELPPSRLGPGDIVALQLKGFNPKEMRFEFRVVEY
jgi:hypothetical protein